MPSLPLPDAPSGARLPAPVGLTFEHHEPGTIGIGESHPRLSWHLQDAPAGWVQTSYEIAWEMTLPGGQARSGAATGARTGAVATETTRATSAVVPSPDQVLVPWPGPGLEARERAVVRVRVAGSDGAWSPWSEPTAAERGLAAADWRADLVGPGYDEGPRDQRRAPWLRRAFTLPSAVAITAARLHVTAHGLAEVELNGVRVGREELLPGWTPYADRLRVFGYDVTNLVRPGENAIGAWLADGWFRGRLGFGGGTWHIYGEHVGLLAQLEITTADGATHVIGTDEHWRSAPGPLTLASLYDGETHDARLETPGWSKPGFDDGDWHPVTVHPLDLEVLAAPDGPPVRCTQELRPLGVTPLPAPGSYLRDAPANDTFVSDGAARTWEPRFTIHGFRFAEVHGWPGELAEGDVVSRVLHSDMTRTGWFHASDPELERLHENVVWSLRSNFVDIPTDCPQRDERLGWTGDLQVFAPTAAFLYDVHGMLADWLRTVASEQQRFGTVPVYVPWIRGADYWQPTWDIALWGDVAALTPLALHERSGDRELLARQYASATAWVDRIADLAGPERLWDTGFQLGDWLDPAAPPDDPARATTDPHLVATAYLARSAAAVAETAEILDLAADAERYAALAAEVRAAFAARYLTSDDPLHRSQTALALALAFGLVPDGDRGPTGAALAALVAAGGARIGTGFAGTPVVTDALSSTGHLPQAYRLLLGHEQPSWLAMVDLGATTIWERWDSMLADGTVNSGEMTSFNHYALGSVADWLHRVVAGLAPAAPGYRRLRLAPRPGGGLTSAGARHLTPYGEASVAWERDGDDLLVRWRVPVGATAEVDVPGLTSFAVGHGAGEVRAPWGAEEQG